MKLLCTLFLFVLAGASANAAVARLEDYNTNQFTTIGGIITIKNGALVTNLVGAGGSSDWTNAAWGLQPILTNSLVDIHHGTNEIWVNQLATGGNGTTNNPWTGLESVNLRKDYTQYHWPAGYYKITNTIDLLGTNTYHLGEAGTVIKFYGTGTAVRFKNTNSWTMGSAFENFRIDCQSAVVPVQHPTAITLVAAVPSIATCTLTNHGYSSGDVIAISGANELDYNGARFIEVIDTNTFTYLVATETTNATTATGTFTSKKASVALEMLGVRNQSVRNLIVGNCTVGITIQACVGGTWDNIRCSRFEEPNWAWTVQPVHALLVGTRVTGSLDYSTTQTIRNFSAEGMSDYGLVLFDAANFTFDIGTSEVNQRGVLVGTGTKITSKDIFFLNWDNEFNTFTNDFHIFANGCVLQSCWADGEVEIAGGHNHIRSGKIARIIIRSHANDTVLDGVHLVAPQYVIDNGTRTRFWGCHYENADGPIDKTSGLLITPKVLPEIAAGDTNTLNTALASFYTVKVNGNFTLANPTNAVAGQRIRMRFQHDNTANPYSVTNFGTAWFLPSWIPQPAFTTANGYAYMDAQYNEITSQWQIDHWVDINGAGTSGLSDNWVASGTTNSSLPGTAFMDSVQVTNNKTGTGALMFGTSPTVTTSVTLTNATAATVPVVISGASGASVDQLQITTGGTNRVQVSNLGALVVSAGSKERPSLGWIDDNDGSGTGFYRGFANVINGSIDGVAVFYMDSSTFRVNSDSATVYLGVGNDLALRRDAAAALQLGADAAAPVHQTLKAHDATGADHLGANLILKGGYGTGIGAGGDLITMTSVSSNASGSVAQIYSTRHYESAKPSPMTNSTANPVLNILINTNHYLACKIFASTFAGDVGGDFQAFAEELMVSAVNKAGTISATVSTSWGTNLAASSASTLTTTWTAVTSGNTLDIKCTPVSSLTPTTYYTKWKVDVLSNDPATIAPYR